MSILINRIEPTTKRQQQRKKQQKLKKKDKIEIEKQQQLLPTITTK